MIKRCFKNALLQILAIIYEVFSLNLNYVYIFKEIINQ